MNMIERLIQELCPNGVEWKEVGDVTQIKKGKQLNKSLLTDDGTYPAYNGGQFESGRTDRYNVDENTTIISQGGASAGFVNFITTKFWANAHCYFLLPDKKIINNKYLYHFIKMKQNNLMESQYGSGIPALKVDSISKIKIPIPPLEIQEEIVKILDKFTDYVTELTTELTLRQKQYHYYRDELFTFENEEVEWKTLGDIGKVSMCKRILKKDTSQDGEIPFYKIGTFGSEPNSFISRSLFEEYKSKFSYPKKGDILISASGTIGRTVIFDGVDSYYQDSNIVWLEHDEKIILNKYLYYFYRTNPWKISIGGTIPRLYNEDIKKTKIPVPPLTAQNKIINYLDNLEKIVNDVNYSLPKEIELRQKQYEFYRDKLLSFD